MSKSPEDIPSQTWYAAGLAFQCQGCGTCCAGPQEGYVWVSDNEITRIAETLEMEEAAFIKKYVRKARGKRCLIEKKSKDCIFLEDGKCQIYLVRPSQCKTWPFWSSNLISPHTWCEASDRCNGINYGKIYPAELIQKILHVEPE